MSDVVGCCNVVAILSMAGMVCLHWMQKLHVHCMSNAGSVWSYAVKFVAEHGRYGSSFMCKTLE